MGGISWNIVPDRQARIKLSPELVPAELSKTWKFLELWVDPVVFPPNILMVVVGEAEDFF